MPAPPPMPEPEAPMDTGTGEFPPLPFRPPFWSPILRSFVRSIFSPAQNRWI